MSLKLSTRGAIALIRPELPLAAGLCVVLGQFLGLGSPPPMSSLAFGFLCGFSLSASAIATNDYFDLEVDRINTPWRPLPAGLVPPGTAFGFGLVLGGLGLVTARLLNSAAFVSALVVWVIGFLYNWKLKGSGILGNLIVAVSVAMTFVIGGIGIGRSFSGSVWLFAVIAFFFDLAEEIAGDAMDADGDRARGSNSLALRWGRNRALRLSAALFGVTLLLSWIPMLQGEFGASYAIPILLMNCLVAVFVVKLLRSRTPSEGRSAMRALYLSASLCLLGFLVRAWRD